MRAVCDVVVLTVVAAFLAVIIYPAYEYAYDESFVRTPALEIPNTWRAAAVLVGAVLLALSAALRFLLLPARIVVPVVAVAFLIAGTLVLAKPMFMAFGNWNLLWYCAIATAVLGWRQLLSRDVAPLTCVIAAGLIFLFVGFAFTNAGAWVEDQSTVNRATLHLAPLIVVWMFVTLRAWQAARAEREPALEARPG